MLATLRGLKDEDSPHSLPPARPAWVLHAAVAALIVLSAGLVYQHFLRSAPALWYAVDHDRNGHYARSQHIAFALRQGSLAGLVREIHAATVWPPLHPLVTGSVLAVGGIDYRVAVLPSLAAWMATCWFAFALARRVAPRCKDLAGGVALLLSLASPAHRAFATDIMIESLGAALTLAALYFYVTARQERSAWRGRCCALLLLALFLTKYNYWTLLAASLVLGALWEFHAVVLTAFRTWWRSGAVRDGVLGQLRHPLTYLLLPALALVLYVKFVGPVTLTLAGKPVKMETLAFPAQLFFILLVLRVLPWWWRSGRHAVVRLPVPARQLIQWHAYPLAVWFLWPGRLGVFLWYVTFGQHGRAGDYSPWAGNLDFYWQRLGQDYHANFASLVLVLVLIALAILAGRRRRSGEAAVFVFLAVAALLTNYHSANRSRFLHSWLAVGWVVAGVGAAAVLERLGESRRASRSGASPVPVFGGALLIAAVAALAALQGRALIQAGHADEGGPHAAQPSFLAVADAVSPELAGASHPVVVAEAPFELLFDWRVGEKRGPHPRLLTLPPELHSLASQKQLEGWLERTSCDRLVLIDAAPAPGLPATSRFDVARFRSLLASSGHFVLASEWHFPTAANVTAEVWRPASARGLTAAK